MIKNYRLLNKSDSDKIILDTLEAGLLAGLPYNGIRKYVRPNLIEIKNKKTKLSKFENIHIVAFGKAADSMTKSIDSILNIKSGIIVMPDKTKPVINKKKFDIVYGTHPIPTKRSYLAAKKVVSFIKSLKPEDFLIFLVSGGGSSLLAYPNGVSLSDKSKTTKILLKSGANIQEINCVRKHLSKIKGGRLLDFLSCESCALIMSDVEDDDMTAISSGCTYYDKTTFTDALKIIKKYGVEKTIPNNIIKIIKQGIKGTISETPKKERIPNQVILSNSDCLNAMKKKLEHDGYSIKQLKIYGDISKAIKRIKVNMPKNKKSALIFGGEITIKVTGNGKGGRAQELVLRILAKKLISENHIIALIGTDGTDGNTRYAGVISKAKYNFSEMQKYLEKNDSNRFFKKYGGLIYTGPTHTNLMDIGIILTIK